MGHVHSARVRSRRRRSALSIFREQRLFVEKNPSGETPESLRLMLLRDQIGHVVSIMREHEEAIDMVRGLLRDEHVGVGTIAADVLREAAAGGVDISLAEPDLIEALSDKYAKKNAASALALFYIRKGDVSSLERLLGHDDNAIRESAADASVSCCSMREWSA
jgi:hypothetical protein